MAHWHMPGRMKKEEEKTWERAHLAEGLQLGQHNDGEEASLRLADAGF